MNGIFIKSNEEGVRLLRKMSNDIVSESGLIVQESLELLDCINEYPALGPHKKEIINLVQNIKDGIYNSMESVKIVSEKLSEKSDELQVWIGGDTLSSSDDTCEISVPGKNKKSGVEINTPAISQSLVEYGDNWAKNLSQEEKDAVISYTGLGYENINDTLRGKCSEFAPGMRKKASILHNVLAKTYIPCDCTLYRGTSMEALGRFKDLSDDELVGKTLMDKGFFSTSFDKNCAFDKEILFVIDVPKGSHGVYVGNISAVGNCEKEVLMRDGQVIRIIDVSRDASGHRIIHVDLYNN